MLSTTAHASYTGATKAVKKVIVYQKLVRKVYENGKTNNEGTQKIADPTIV